MERKLLGQLAGAKQTADRKGQIARRASTEPAALSFAQQRLWFLEKFDPGSNAYHIPRALRVHGVLDVEALRFALNAIVARHEALRTNFRDQGGEPVQVVRSDASVELRELDLTPLPKADAETELARVFRDETRRPFQLGTDLMLRGVVARLGPEDHGLLLVMHHIAADGWSMGIFIRELVELYDAHRAGRPVTLPPLPIQYADFSVWQRQWLSGTELARQLDYWKRQLAGAPALEMPTDHPRPAVLGSAGERQTLMIPTALHEAMKAVGKQSGTTLFMTLLAAFQVLLHRYTGQDDISVGSPIAGRNRAETEALIGLFLNTLVLRADLSGDPTFPVLLKRVKEVALGAFAHQDMPFERLVEELRPERSTSRTPLFQVMFNLQTAPKDKLELAGLSLQTVEVDSGTTKFDLTLSLYEGPNGLKAYASYNTDLFDGATITRFLGHYQNLLASIAAHPDLPLSQLPIIDDGESEQLLVTWNQTRADFPSQLCLQEMVGEQAGRTPSAVAISCAGKDLSYADLDRRSNQLARLLKREGVGAESLVGILCGRSIDMVVGMLAVLKAGGAYVPLDPAYPRDRLAFMIADSGLSVLLTQQKLVDTLPEHQAKVIRLDADRPQIDAEDPEKLERCATPASLAYVIYTSGSTGKPKGVQIEHSALVNFLHSMKERPGLSSKDRLLAVTSLSFDIAGLELWLPLTVGAHVEVTVEAEVMDGKSLSRKIVESGITVVQATPSTFQLLSATGWQALRGVKVLVGGEAVPRELATRLCENAASAWNMYGPTETTIWSTVQQLSSQPGPVFIGRPINNTQIYILDGARGLAPIGVPGELYIGGAGLSRGYLGRSELTAERFIPSPFDPAPGTRLYRTGDLCRYRPDGTIEFIRRIDHQVKLRGYRIELGEIEAVLGAHPAVREVVAVVREDSPGDPRLCAYLALRPSAQATAAELRDHVRQKLPDYMLPSAFLTLEALPRTPNNKIDRKALPAPEAGAGTASRGFVAPRNAVEEKLAQIWRDTLRLPTVSVTDSFFDLGGHSMLAAQMMTAVEAAFNKTIPLAALFVNQTIEQLARLYTVADAVPAKWPLLIPIQPKGSKPPLFCVSTFNVSALGYIALARNLGLDQPIYGLQSQYRFEGKKPYQRFEFQTVAEQYLAGMKEVQPHGPYHLLGTCEGALISFEMARLLRASGEQVGLLGFVDAWPIENTRRHFFTKLETYRRVVVKRWRKIERAPQGTKMLVLKEQLSGVASNQFKIAKRALGKLGLGSSPSSEATAAGSAEPATDELLPFDDAYKNYYWPGPDFVPPTVDTVISLFRIRDQPIWRINDPTCGWGARTTKSVDIHTINSDHFSLLREPYVKVLAQKVSACLARGAGRDKQA